jgi:DNA-directed RNA polymerase specialized sigma24 family protein
MATRPHRTERSERRARILAEALAAGRQVLRRQAARNADRAADAEEALQDACVDFLRYYDDEPGEHALRYLMLAVKHRAWALTHHSLRGSPGELELTTTDALEAGEPRLAVLSDGPGPAERAEREETVSDFRVAWAALKPDQRKALALLALGYSYREIATRRGWTYTKVNRCIAEGRAALRAFTAECGEFPVASVKEQGVRQPP